MSEPSAQPTCPHCAAQVTIDASFCMKCGAALSSVSADAGAATTSTVPPVQTTALAANGGWWAGRSGRQKVGIVAGDYTPRQGGRVRVPPTDEDDSWLEESSIQSHVVQWLRAEGWRIIRQASGREHGTDIDAERDGVLLAVEVKGHPRRLHVFGVNKGQARKWHPAAQVRTYYGTALHSAISMLHTDPDRQAAIALPDVPAYRALVKRTRDPLTKLGIMTWFVTKDGVVTHG